MEYFYSITQLHHQNTTSTSFLLSLTQWAVMSQNVSHGWVQGRRRKKKQHLGFYVFLYFGAGTISLLNIDIIQSNSLAFSLNSFHAKPHHWRRSCEAVCDCESCGFSSTHTLHRLFCWNHNNKKNTMLVMWVSGKTVCSHVQVRFSLDPAWALIGWRISHIPGGIWINKQSGRFCKRLWIFVSLC